MAPNGLTFLSNGRCTLLTGSEPEVGKMAQTVETKRLLLEPGYLGAALVALGAVLLGVIGYQMGFLGFVYGLMLPQAFSRAWIS